MKVSDAMNPYSEGLRHGYEDQAAAILKILDMDISDAAKLEQIRQRCESLPYTEVETSGGVS